MTDGGRISTLIEVDLQSSRRGLPSQLGADLGGQSVLQCTLDRVAAAQRLEPPLLLVRREDEARLRQLVGDRPARVFPHALPELDQTPAIRRSRKWGKEGWRGGLLDSYFVSEQGNSVLIDAVLQQKGWTQAMLLPSAAPFLDPELLDELAGHCLDRTDRQQLYLSTAPPGIAGDVIHASAAHVVAEAAVPLDALVRVEPDRPLSDPERWAHHFPEEITGFRGRFTVDSHSALQLSRVLWERHGGPAPCRDLFEMLRGDPDLAAGPVPEELIVELGGDEGGICPTRPGRATGPIADGVFARVIEACGQRDDLLITLGGGFHDPLLDQALEERIAAARAAGAFGIHVATPGARLTPERSAQLIAAAPDVITVDLVAPEARQLEQMAPGTPHLSDRERGLENLLTAGSEVSDPPFVLVSIVFDEHTALHFDRYFDRWYGRVDRVLFRGADGGRGEAVPTSMGIFAPPHRVACSRLQAQLRIEADGAVPLCDRDPLHATRCGDLARQSITEVWQGEVLRHARTLHRDRQWERVGHCGPCTSWFRFDGPAPDGSLCAVAADERNG